LAKLDMNIYRISNFFIYAPSALTTASAAVTVSRSIYARYIEYEYI
jgi:hypothetical protein